MMDLARSSALHALDRIEAILAIGAREGLLDARLAPDMDPFTHQIAMATGFTLRSVLPVGGCAVPRIDLADTAEDLAAAIAAARDTLATLALAESVASIEHIAGEARLSQPPADYLTLFALPNLWFHVAIAYAILRANGVAVGKADFDGLHRYDG